MQTTAVQIGPGTCCSGRRSGWTFGPPRVPRSGSTACEDARATGSTTSGRERVCFYPSQRTSEQGACRPKHRGGFFDAGNRNLVQRVDFEELLRSGVPAEQYAKAGRLLRGSSSQQLLEFAGATFSADERRDLEALLQWPGSYGSDSPEDLPLPPMLDECTREELLR